MTMATPSSYAAESVVRIPTTLILGIVFAAYLSWRPSVDVMFTLSDICLILGGITMLMRRQVPREPFSVVSPLWYGGFILMLGGLLASSLFSGDPTRWPIVAVQYSMAWAVLPFLISGHDSFNTHRLARFFLLGVVAMELIGILVYFTFSGSFMQARTLLGFDFISGSNRLGAFATDANWNGATIAMALPFVFYLHGRGGIGHCQAAIALALLIFALILTASVTAFGTTCLTIILFVIVGDRRLRAAAMMMLLASFAIVLVLEVSGRGLPAVFQKRVATALESGSLAQAGTYEGRMHLIEDAWQRVGDHMWLGVGVDQDRVVSQERAPVHNMYLLLWVEGGFVALLGWLAMMAAALAIVLAAFYRDRLSGALGLTVLMSFLVFSAASPHMYARLWAVPVLLALAIAMNAGGGHLRALANWRYRQMARRLARGQG